MHRQRQFFVYIMTNRSGTLYTGVSNDLLVRTFKHRLKMYSSSFTARYQIDRVVWYEVTENVEAAIYREKQIKRMLRKQKITLIESANPTWRDLSQDWLGPYESPAVVQEGGLPRPGLAGNYPVKTNGDRTSP